MDKSNFVHFVISVRLHCTIFTNLARFNGDIDRTVLRGCDNRPEWTKMQICIISS